MHIRPTDAHLSRSDAIVLRLGPRDFAWMTLLGTAARGPAGLDELLAGALALASGQWSPTRDVLLACVEEMLAGGYLGDGEGVLALTPRGRGTLARLLDMPTDRVTTPAGQYGVALKMQLLDLLPARQRTQVLQGVILAHEMELARQADEVGPVGPFGLLWRNCQTERLRRDLAALRAAAEKAGCKGCGRCACGSARH